MFYKKAQAAMEFLMTYGWAILVVLVAIGALAYFGVLNPQRFLPDSCQGPAGFDCIDKAQVDASGAAGTDYIEIIAKNNIGYSMKLKDASDAGLSATLANSQQCPSALFTIDDGPVAPGANQNGGIQASTATGGGAPGSLNAVAAGGLTIEPGDYAKIKVFCNGDMAPGRFKGDFFFFFFIY